MLGGQLALRSRHTFAFARANPESKQIEPKSMYLGKYENVIVACGIYKG